MWLLHPVASTSSPCSLNFSPSLPSDHGAHLENKMRHSGCNLLLVTARALGFASLPLSLFFFLPLSLSVYIWSQLQHLRLSVVCHQWNKWSNWKDCIVLENSMGDIPYHLRPFVTSSQHCLYFIKYGLGMSHLNITQKDRCVGVCLCPTMSYMMPFCGNKWT